MSIDVHQVITNAHLNIHNKIAKQDLYGRSSSLKGRPPETQLNLLSLYMDFHLFGHLSISYNTRGLPSVNYVGPFKHSQTPVSFHTDIHLDLCGCPSPFIRGSINTSMG